MTGRYSGELEETELRLGLPGGRGDSGGEGDMAVKATGAKRGFAETNVDLELNLPAGGAASKMSDSGKDVPKEMNILPRSNDPSKPPAPKAQVVGWPPLRSFRKNVLSVQSGKNNLDEADKVIASGGVLVKVSMDGAPYLRKVDLNMFKSYQDLSIALDNMFSSFTTRKCGSHEGINGRDFMNEGKLMDLINGSDFVPTYEDKDGDWMLVGDVPWEMFVDSCKRLRIMKGSESIGLAPRTVEKMQEQTVKSLLPQPAHSISRKPVEYQPSMVKTRP